MECGRYESAPAAAPGAGNRPDGRAATCPEVFFSGFEVMWRPLLLLILFAGLASAQKTPVQWESVRGINYFPSYARNAHEMWLRYDAPTVERELRWLRGLGFNSVRLWLSEKAFRASPAEFRANLQACLRSCRRWGMTAMPVLFDSCGIEERPGAADLPVGEIYRRLLDSARFSPAEKQLIRSRYAEFATGRGQDMLAPYSEDMPYDILFWQHWSPNPGLRRLTPRHWEQLDRYAAAAVEAARGEPNVIAFDVMNEPACLFDLAGVQPQAALERVQAFLEHMARRVNDATDVAVTIGSSDWQKMEASAPWQDVLSFHCYRSGEQLRTEIEKAREAARRAGKPVLLTECLANTDNWLQIHGEERLSTDESQLRHYQQNLPIVLGAGIGWYAWGGVAGSGFTPFTDLIFPNGYRRPAAEYLANTLRNRKEKK
jgi:hypothetical protein